ncbi:phytoene desaturase family protein [Nitratireductor thuwali]|uniref:Pyridine nucleotide-disulfide oxidoreductase domain-containing protein 2 n=1 Tax=Nitratireductor thuwali TaxID=2267699 RepID=A0ABY5MFE2_9HYPH|nr:zeta-carotene-forming phytoene desaturase [Nitratireductor thuwali]
MQADHVIIGGGINGLVAAAMLAGQGGKVVLLDRAAHLGGCLFSDEVTAPGFTHDVMAATFVLFLTGPAHVDLGEDLARHGLEFCNTPHPTAVLRPDGSSAVLTTDRAANVAAFNRLAPGDGEAHAADIGGIEANASLLFGLLGEGLWSGGTAKLLAKEAWQRGPRSLAAYLGEALKPARAWLESAYSSPTLQALYAPWTLHCGLSPEDAYSAQMGKVVAFALEAAGAPIAKGGAGRAASAFRVLIEERGGTVRTGAHVERILVESGRATGVHLQGGEVVRAAKSVIASVAPGQLYGPLLSEEAPPAEREAARRYRHGRGNFQLHYALDRPPQWKAEGLEQVALIHLTDGIDAVSKSHNEATRGLLPETPTLCVGQPAALDPSRCPPGNAILWIQVPDAPREIKGDAAGTIAGTGLWDERTREAFADRIEAILAKHIGGFSETILGRRAYSPADLEAINANLVGGDPYGGACTIDQFFLWRPFPGSVNHRTPVKGLYHIGASTHPGPGLGGGSGYMLAKELG